jgi:hypothetical protein
MTYFSWNNCSLLATTQRATQQQQHNNTTATATQHDSNDSISFFNICNQETALPREPSSPPFQ